MAEAVTIVLVPGGSCGPWVWSLLGPELDSRRVAHVDVELPTVGAGVDPNLDVHTDADHVRRLLDEIEGPLVLCGNSYAGTVITEASAGHPHVVHLVYLAAFMPDADDVLASFVPSSLTPEFSRGLFFRDDGLLDGDRHVLRTCCFQQSSPEVAEWAASQMRPMAMGRGDRPGVTAVGWRTIPSTYIVCSEDRTIRPEAQRRWARQRATDSLELPFDHIAALSHPVEVADILAGIARSSAAGRPG